MKLLRRAVDDTFTAYIFLYHGRENQRRYLNVQLKNRTEELLELFLNYADLNTTRVYARIPSEEMMITYQNIMG
ncbi:hypothetical protein [Sporosarcina saromensis]|uniref:hypothetical protein n=1 Tax=Sporosarcina saromensis TaxID=359365 RepID=UPI00295EEB34|nr:hypothetical protein [Sporosarcina saromensis]